MLLAQEDMSLKARRCTDAHHDNQLRVPCGIFGCAVILDCVQWTCSSFVHCKFLYHNRELGRPSFLHNVIFDDSIIQSIIWPCLWRNSTRVTELAIEIHGCSGPLPMDTVGTESPDACAVLTVLRYKQLNDQEVRFFHRRGWKMSLSLEDTN
ncbi:hypothetical protein GQ600_6156 [Phytophthora cactorum]|nr:hypothetical protein GQ600_6156 [Phytophthora cactorum]